MVGARRLDFTLFVSEPVLDEAGGGDPDAATQRLAVVDGIDILEVTDEAIELAELLLRAGAIPKEAAIDALHVALACVNGIHYLLTWNCKHIANAERFEAIQVVCVESGYKPPIICTPDELTGNTDMAWEDPIVKEVRDIREAIAIRHHHDIRAIGRYYQRKQEQTSHKLVTRVPRQIEPQVKNS